jgi:hypothetical protein
MTTATHRAMTLTQALNRARKLWGKQARVSDSGWRHASSPEERDAASVRYRELVASPPTPVTPETFDPTATIADYLVARAIYTAAWRLWREARDEAQSTSNHYRYSVGVVGMGGLAYIVKGVGDSWQEAFNAAHAAGAR